MSGAHISLRKCFMKIYNSLDEFNLDVDTAVTIGKFDGLHRGHKLLCENLFSLEREGLKSLVISFVDPPRSIVRKKDLIDTPENSSNISPNGITDSADYKKIVTNDEKRALVRDSGISIFIECPFDEKLMKTEPSDFIKRLACDLNMKYLVVGRDFRFGYKGAGDVALLEKLSGEMNFKLKVIDKLQEDNIDISSTRIRDEIKNGNITKANQLMGRNYFIYGEVVYGRQIGSKIDFPTINIIPAKDKLIPKNGVYISMVKIGSSIYRGITNVGIRPTFDDGDNLSIETHIFNFDSNVYGKEVMVVFLKEMRGEIKFNSAEELRTQLMKDKNVGIDFFTNEHVTFDI